MKKTVLISLLCLIIDQLIKNILLSTMEIGQSITVIKNFFNITLVLNNGAAFSILNSNVLFLIFVSIGALVIIFTYLFKGNNLKQKEYIIYGILVGGILGNLIDRIFNNSVTDYIDFNIFGYDFPIFNFADICIVISMFLILIDMVRDGKNENKSR